MDGPMLGVDPDVVEQDVGNFWRTLYKLEKGFSDNPSPKKMASKVKNKVEEFKENLPLVGCMFNPGKHQPVMSYYTESDHFEMQYICSIKLHAHHNCLDTGCCSLRIDILGKIIVLFVVILTLCSILNPGLRDRHWDQISEIVGYPLKPDDDMPLSKLVAMNLDSYIAKFEGISEAASKEFSLEKALEKMKSEWVDVSRSSSHSYHG